MNLDIQSPHHLKRINITYQSLFTYHRVVSSRGPFMLRILAAASSLISINHKSINQSSSRKSRSPDTRFLARAMDKQQQFQCCITNVMSPRRDIATTKFHTKFPESNYIQDTSFINVGSPSEFTKSWSRLEQH